MYPREVQIAARRACSVGLLLAAVGAVARADDKGLRYKSDDGKYSVELPAAWNVTSGSIEGLEMLRLRAAPPGVDGDVVVTVWLLQGQRDSHRQAFKERDLRKRDPETLSATAETSPIPHMLCRYRADDGTERMKAVAYSMVRRNGISVGFTCPIASWPALRDTFLRVAISLAADIEEWPAHPADFRRDTRDGFVYLVHPDVKPAQAKEVQALVRRVAGKFEAVHGKIPVQEENPPIVVVLRSIEDGRKLYDMKSATYGIAFDALGGRLFATPLPENDGTTRAACVMKAYELMFVQRYGSVNPFWMYCGEGRLAWVEELTGAKPPVVDSPLFKDISGPVQSFAELVEQEAKSSFGDPFRAHAAAYVLFFREGPAKYRKAYQAFRADVAANYDIVPALEKHLLTLDQPTLQRDLGRWVANSVRDPDRR